MANTPDESRSLPPTMIRPRQLIVPNLSEKQMDGAGSSADRYSVEEGLTFVIPVVTASKTGAYRRNKPKAL